MTITLNTRDSDFATGFAALVAGQRAVVEDVDAIAQEIIAKVRAQGDAAVIALTTQFDRLDLTPETMRLSPQEIAEAVAACPADLRAAMKLAAGRIRNFHERQRPQPLGYKDEDGVILGARWTPLDAVGVYVPGGRAAYPSSVLMNAVPAKVAGVERIAMVVPMPDGIVNPAVIAAADIAGVDEIYRIGGAQAVAALAYGTESIAPVDKIVGPGNAYVAAAKRLVFGRVGIDLIAGPSEILVVADAQNDPRWIAADLLSQAEHDPAAQSILITESAAFAAAVATAIEDHLSRLPRAAIARQSWQDNGAMIVVDDLLAEAPALIDQLAPEHLELAIADPDSLAERVRHAGAVFLGRHTPEAIGDYVAGPNHVLPTSRSARFFSGLNLLDFMKRTTFVGCTPESLARIGPAAVAMAEAEGLDAHALSVGLRLSGKTGG